MSIEKLATFNFRNLAYDSLILHPELNFVIGNNGSGKSSLLEAIFYLGHGKSFRTTKLESLVAHDEEKFVISVTDDKTNRLGVSRTVNTQETEIKINDVKHSRLSELARSIAVQIVTPESFKLFFGGPKERRKFIDLGLFHVKHSFSEQWKQFSRVLKQRNACLKNKVDSNTLDYWSDLFCQHSLVIAECRKEYIEALSEEVSFWLQALLPQLVDNLSIHYQQGWNQKKTLNDVLHENRTRELNFGYSVAGPQKFDVKFLLSGVPLENALSRGQQKLFLLALTLAQTKLIEKVKQVKPILLIDDIGAELDVNSRQLLASVLTKVDCQVIITAIEENVLESIKNVNNNFKMFHVEHGKLSAISE